MFFSLPVFQTNKQQQHWNVLSGDGSSTGEMLQAARLRRRQPAQQHRGLQTLHQSADSTCWRSGCRAQSSSFKHICKSGLCVCVCVELPPITATSDRSSLNVDLLGIKSSPGSEEQPVTSMRSQHGPNVYFPPAKKPLNDS